MVLAIDVGNSDTKLGLWEGSRWREVWRGATNRLDSLESTRAWLSELAIPHDLETVCASSVVPDADAALLRACIAVFGQPPRFLTAESQTSMAIRYETPESLGSDRIANALGARGLLGPPAIAVSFGTATTIDVVDPAGAYLGGAILPGPSLAAEALAGRSSKLPLVAAHPPERAIGRSTEECLLVGTVVGLADSVDGLVQRMRAELGFDAPCVATGGNGETLARFCRAAARYEANLTLLGIILGLTGAP
jgi:type III pantothenate kinase